MDDCAEEFQSPRGGRFRREKAAIDRDVAKERRPTREALKLAKARLLLIQADIAEQQARRESVLAAAFEDAIEESIEEAASAKLATAPSETPSAPSTAGARRVPAETRAMDMDTMVAADRVSSVAIVKVSAARYGV